MKQQNISQDLILYKNIIDDEAKQAYFEELQSTLRWQHEHIKIFGKTYQSPRLTAWYGEKGIQYCYSGINHVAESWGDSLFDLKCLTEKMCNHTFNSVLCNLYRDGQDSMGWHSDDEKSLGEQPVIASLSLGTTRKFKLRHKINKETINIMLEAGDLLLMKGDSQKDWQHALPKMSKVSSARINLTFRKILQ